MRTLVSAYFEYEHNPAAVVRGLVRQRRFGAAMLGYLVAAICWVCFFWMGAGLGTWGFIWRLMFFWLLEISLGYLWAALSGLFLNFFSHENGSSAMFIALGLSGFVQSLLLCFTLCAAKFTGLVCLSALAVVITFVFRFGFAVVNTARASQVGLNKALGALCFVLIPVGVAVCLFFGAIILLISLAV